MKSIAVIFSILLILTGMTLTSVTYGNEPKKDVIRQYYFDRIESSDQFIDAQHFPISQSLIFSDDCPDIEWEKTYGDLGGESGTSVYQTLDGGYAISATKTPQGGDNSDIWIVKIDHNGNEVWDKIYGGSSNEFAANIQQTSDENYIIFGNTNSYGSANSNAWLIRTDSQGDVIWQKTFGPGENNSVSNGFVTSEGYIIFVGTTTSSDNSDVWVLKADMDGNKVWEKTFDKSRYDGGIRICETSDGNFVVLGFFAKATTARNIWLIKLDKNGDKTKENTLGKSYLGAIFFGQDISSTYDGGCIIAGYRNYALDLLDFDYTLWKINSNLEVEDDEWVIDSSEDIEMLTGVRQLSDGYIAVGNNLDTQDVTVIKTNSIGDLECSKYLGGSEFDMLNWVERTNDNSFITVGFTLSYGTGNGDVWLIKFQGTNTPPTVEITSPKDGQIVTGEIPISGTASDANGYGTLEKIIVTIGNDSVGHDANGTTSWRYVWDTTTVSNGNYEIKAKSYDGKEYSLKDRINVTVFNNQPPNAPTDPNPEDGATNNVSVNPTLSVLVSDPDGDTMDVTFYNASDNSIIDTDKSVLSGGSASVTWSGLAYSTIYSWYAVADDGIDTTQSDTWSFTTEGEKNRPPNKPSKPSGPSSGTSGNSYKYSSTTTDPDGDDVKYGWDWNGDGTADEWTSFYGSGDAVTTSHSWSDGTYYVKVIAEDTNGAQSDWSDSLPVTMPKNKPYINTPFLNFLENHPHMFPILQLLLRLMRNSQQSLFSFL